MEFFNSTKLFVFVSLKYISFIKQRCQFEFKGKRQKGEMN